MTVSELITALQAFPGDAEVMATWESTFEDVSVYRAKDGTVIIDADHESYREYIEDGRLAP